MKKIVCIVFAVMCAASLTAALPMVELKDIHGKTVHIETLAQQGKPVIISFFATWCKPCMRELNAIHEEYEEWKEETGVEMYIVSIDQGQDCKKVKPLVDGFNWEYHVLLDPNGELKRAMNVQNVPHLFVIDSNGNIVYNHSGYTDGEEAEIRKML